MTCSHRVNPGIVIQLCSLSHALHDALKTDSVNVCDDGTLCSRDRVYSRDRVWTKSTEWLQVKVIVPESLYNEKRNYYDTIVGSH